MVETLKDSIAEAMRECWYRGHTYGYDGKGMDLVGVEKWCDEQAAGVIRRAEPAAHDDGRVRDPRHDDLGIAPGALDGDVEALENVLIVASVLDRARVPDDTVVSVGRWYTPVPGYPDNFQGDVALTAGDFRGAVRAVSALHTRTVGERQEWVPLGELRIICNSAYAQCEKPGDVIQAIEVLDGWLKARGTPMPDKGSVGGWVVSPISEEDPK